MAHQDESQPDLAKRVEMEQKQKPADKNQRERKRRRHDDDNGFEKWGGYMNAKVSKLEEQYSVEAGKSTGLFTGIAIFVNGYTEPSGEELKRIMLSNGGTYHHYYSRRRTTHIIARNLPHTKVRNMDTSRIVKASWIVDSLAVGKVLDFSNYLLYTHQNSLQPRLTFPTVVRRSERTKQQPATLINHENVSCSKGSDVNCERPEGHQKIFERFGNNEQTKVTEARINEVNEVSQMNDQKTEFPIVQKCMKNVTKEKPESNRARLKETSATAEQCGDVIDISEVSDSSPDIIQLSDSQHTNIVSSNSIPGFPNSGKSDTCDSGNDRLVVQQADPSNLVTAITNNEITIIGDHRNSAKSYSVASDITSNTSPNLNGNNDNNGTNATNTSKSVPRTASPSLFSSSEGSSSQTSYGSRSRLSQAVSSGRSSNSQDLPCSGRVAAECEAAAVVATIGHHSRAFDFNDDDDMFADECLDVAGDDRLPHGASDDIFSAGAPDGNSAEGKELPHGASDDMFSADAPDGNSVEGRGSPRGASDHELLSPHPVDDNVEMEAGVQVSVPKVNSSSVTITKASETNGNHSLGSGTGNKSRVSNTTNPNFLSDFYNNSRLHHLSTMGAMFKDYVVQLLKKPPDNSGKEHFKHWLKTNSLSSCSGASFKLPDVASNSSLRYKKSTDERFVMHIDMDCFFVSVGLRNRPDLVGKPVAVTHAKGNPGNRRAGADPQAEFALYKQRLKEKSEKKSIASASKNKSNAINVTANIASRDLIVTNKNQDPGVGTNNHVMAAGESDEGFDDWGDFNDDEDATLQQLLEAVDPVTDCQLSGANCNNRHQQSLLSSKACDGNSAAYSIGKDQSDLVQDRNNTNWSVNDGSTSAPGFSSSASIEQAARGTPNAALDNSSMAARPGSRDGRHFEGKLPGKTGRLLLDSSSSLAEVASCSYEARRAGVTNGMYLGAALQLCPDLRTIPYDFEGYKQVSYQLYDMVASYSRELEAVSCDELYVDVTELVRECAELLAEEEPFSRTPLLLAQCLREHVTSVTGCGCSAGVGGNKLAARLATKLAKPLGHVHLDQHRLQEHLKTLPVRELPGVGGSLSQRLSSAGVTLCGQLQGWSQARLAGLCGARTAATLLQQCWGRDNRPVTSRHVRKSVSAEVNYGIRFSTTADVEDFLRQLCCEVSQRLVAVDLQGRCITLKLKVRAKNAPRETAKYMGHGVCDNIAKSITLDRCTDSEAVILREVLALVRQAAAGVPPSDYRGVGVQVSRLNNEGADGGHAAATGATAITKFFVKGDTKRRQSDAAGRDVSDVDVLKSANLDNSSPGVNVQDSDRITNANTSRESTVDNSIQSPALSRSELTSKNRTAGNMERFLQKRTTSRNSQTVDGGAAGSTKTIDVEVLRSLPADIREQIIREYREQGYIIPDIDAVSADAAAASSKTSPPGSISNKKRSLPLLSEAAGVNCAPKSSVYDDPKPGPSGYRNPHHSRECQPVEQCSSSYSSSDAGACSASGVDIASNGTVETRVDVAVNGVYHNRVVSSTCDYGEKLSSNDDVAVAGGTIVGGGGSIDAETSLQDLDEERLEQDLSANLSQLDGSFLLALPPELQQEMRRDYSRQKRVLNGLTSPKKLLTLAPSPDNSPNKLPSLPSLSGSTLRRGRRRGRPPKSDQLRGGVAAGGATAAGLPVAPARKRRGRGRGKGRVTAATGVHRDAGAGAGASHDPAEALTMAAAGGASSDGAGDTVEAAAAAAPSTAPCSPPPPSLCGEVSLSAVRRLVRQWVESCQEPDDQDTAILAHYYCSLAQHSQLEMLDLLVKFLHRQISRLPADGLAAWRNVYSDVLAQLQEVMMTHYHAPLRVVNTFQ